MTASSAASANAWTRRMPVDDRARSCRVASRRPARPAATRPTRRGRAGASRPAVPRGRQSTTSTAEAMTAKGTVPAHARARPTRHRKPASPSTASPSARSAPACSSCSASQQGDSRSAGRQDRPQAARAAHLRGRRRQDEPERGGHERARSCASPSSRSTATRARATARASSTAAPPETGRAALRTGARKRSNAQGRPVWRTHARRARQRRPRDGHRRGLTAPQDQGYTLRARTFICGRSAAPGGGLRSPPFSFLGEMQHAGPGPSDRYRAATRLRISGG